MRYRPCGQLVLLLEKEFALPRAADNRQHLCPTKGLQNGDFSSNESPGLWHLACRIIEQAAIEMLEEALWQVQMIDGSSIETPETNGDGVGWP